MTVTDSQKFNIKWVNWILAVLFIGLLIILAFAIHQKKPNALLFIGSGIALIFLLFLLFNITKLEINLLETAIEYQFFPFTFKKHSISISDIKAIYIKNIDPLNEFGGYGLRIKKKTTGYIFSQKNLFIELKNGKTVVLSISDTEKVQEYLNSISNRL